MKYDKYWKAGAFGDHIGNGPNMRETFKRCGYYMKPFSTKKGHTIRWVAIMWKVKFKFFFNFEIGDIRL